MSDTLQLDVNDLTIEEIEIIEDYINLPIDQCFSEGAKRGKTLRAFAYIGLRRKDPATTWEDAGRQKIILSEDENPTPASAS